MNNHLSRLTSSRNQTTSQNTNTNNNSAVSGRNQIRVLRGQSDAVTTTTEDLSSMLDLNNDNNLSDEEIVSGILKSRRNGSSRRFIKAVGDTVDGLGRRGDDLERLANQIDSDQNGALDRELMAKTLINSIIKPNGVNQSENSTLLGIARNDPDFTRIQALIRKIPFREGMNSSAMLGALATAEAGNKITAQDRNFIMTTMGLNSRTAEYELMQGHIRNFQSWQPNGFANGYASDQIVLRRIGENLRGITNDGSDVLSVIASNPKYDRFRSLLSEVSTGNVNAFDKSSFIKIAYKAYLGQITPEEHHLINTEVLNYFHTVSGMPEIANAFDHAAYVNIFKELDPNKTGILSRDKFNEINNYLSNRGSYRDAAKDRLYNFDGRGPAEVDQQDHLYLYEVSSVIR